MGIRLIKQIQWSPRYESLVLEAQSPRGQKEKEPVPEGTWRTGETQDAGGFDDEGPAMRMRPDDPPLKDSRP